MGNINIYLPKNNALYVSILSILILFAVIIYFNPKLFVFLFSRAIIAVIILVKDAIGSFSFVQDCLGSLKKMASLPNEESELKRIDHFLIS